ncbi:MAG: hypothetical protein ACE5K0_04245 [Candidatus Methanofastidiosia archaeon]
MIEPKSKMDSGLKSRRNRWILLFEYLLLKAWFKNKDLKNKDFFNTFYNSNLKEDIGIFYVDKINLKYTEGKISEAEVDFHFDLKETEVIAEPKNLDPKYSNEEIEGDGMAFSWHMKKGKGEIILEPIGDTQLQVIVVKDMFVEVFKQFLKIFKKTHNIKSKDKIVKYKSSGRII